MHFIAARHSCINATPLRIAHHIFWAFFDQICPLQTTRTRPLPYGKVRSKRVVSGRDKNLCTAARGLQAAEQAAECLNAGLLHCRLTEGDQVSGRDWLVAFAAVRSGDGKGRGNDVRKAGTRPKKRAGTRPALL